MSDFFSAIKNRRTRYSLSKDSGISKQDIQTIVQTTLDLSPSAYNAQTQRVVILFGEQSDKFWDITRDELKKIAPEKGFERTIEKLKGFAAGDGTILYFIDNSTVTKSQETNAMYADKILTWSYQENAITQFSIWTALAEIGVGASLQHYNPVVDEAIKKEFNIPASWQLNAQMPFGKSIADDLPRDVIPSKDKLLIF